MQHDDRKIVLPLEDSPELFGVFASLDTHRQFRDITRKAIDSGLVPETTTLTKEGGLAMIFRARGLYAFIEVGPEGDMRALVSDLSFFTSCWEFSPLEMQISIDLLKTYL